MTNANTKGETMDDKIKNLKPGQEVKINSKLIVERSGKGDLLRFVKITKNGWEVIKTEKF